MYSVCKCKHILCHVFCDCIMVLQNVPGQRWYQAEDKVEQNFQPTLNMHQKQETNFLWFTPLKIGNNFYHCKAKPDPDHSITLVSFLDLAMVS